MATELGWPGPLHLVTAGTGVSPCHGEQLHVVEVRAVVEQSWHLGMGLESTQCFSCSLRLSSFFSICFPHLDLLIFSSSCYSCHPLPHLLLGCLPLLLSSPLFLLAFMPFSLIISPPCSLSPQPLFQGRGRVTLPSPGPSQPQHCPQLVLMSLGCDRAVPPAQATAPPPCSPACPLQPVKTNGAEPTMSAHLSRGIQTPRPKGGGLPGSQEGGSSEELG